MNTTTPPKELILDGSRYLVTIGFDRLITTEGPFRLHSHADPANYPGFQISGHATIQDKDSCRQAFTRIITTSIWMGYLTGMTFEELFFLTNTKSGVLQKTVVTPGKMEKMIDCLALRFIAHSAFAAGCVMRFTPLNIDGRDKDLVDFGLVEGTEVIPADSQFVEQ